MHRYELEKIDIKSISKVCLVLGLLPGLIFGLITFFLLLVTGLMSFWWALLTSFCSICFYTVLGTGIMALASWIYNFAAERVGGVEITIKEVQYFAPAPINEANDSILV